MNNFYTKVGDKANVYEVFELPKTSNVMYKNVTSVNRNYCSKTNFNVAFERLDETSILLAKTLIFNAFRFEANVKKAVSKLKDSPVKVLALSGEGDRLHAKFNGRVYFVSLTENVLPTMLDVTERPEHEVCFRAIVTVN